MYDKKLLKKNPEMLVLHVRYYKIKKKLILERFEEM